MQPAGFAPTCILPPAAVPLPLSRFGLRPQPLPPPPPPLLRRAACRPDLVEAESISLDSNNSEGFKKRNSPPGQEMSGCLLLQDRSHCGRLFALSRPLHQLCNLSPAFPLRDARRRSRFLPSVARTCLWREIHGLKWKQFTCVRLTLCTL